MTQPNYTAEVAAALAARGYTPAPEREPEPPVPDGHSRYFLAVGGSTISGVGPNDEVAAHLRAIADRIDPPRRNYPA